MEPVFGFILFFIVTTIVCVVANKRGQTWPLYLTVCLFGAPVAAMVFNQVGGGTAAGVGAFLVPIGCLFYSLATATGKDEAVGSSEGYKKCPFCAEAVRIEAIKCKHCGSALS